jgi:hypothetical protein
MKSTTSADGTTALITLLESIFAQVPGTITALDKFMPSTKATEPLQHDPVLRTCISCGWGYSNNGRAVGIMTACHNCAKRTFTLTELNECFNIKRTQAMGIRHSTGPSKLLL